MFCSAYTTSWRVENIGLDRYGPRTRLVSVQRKYYGKANARHLTVTSRRIIFPVQLGAPHRLSCSSREWSALIDIHQRRYVPVPARRTCAASTSPMV